MVFTETRYWGCSSLEASDAIEAPPVGSPLTYLRAHCAALLTPAARAISITPHHAHCAAVSEMCQSPAKGAPGSSPL